jgi:hypothetical protein
LHWTSSLLTQWYGTSPVGMEGDARTLPQSVRYLLSGDAAQRVLVADAFRRQAEDSDWAGPLLAELALDPYSAVRWVAFGALQQLPTVAGDAALPTFDPLASVAERRALRNAVLERYAAKREPLSKQPPALRSLLHEDGSLNRERAAELLSLRDDRAVTISE